MEQSERYKQQQQQDYHSKGFGDFPPTPQMRQPQPSSRIRFADDTKPSAREYDDSITLNRRDGTVPDKTKKQVLVLGGDRSRGQGTQQYTPHHNSNMNAPTSSSEHNNRMVSSSTPPSSQPNNTLDFSMIATPGGQRHARVMINDETASYTSESSSHFATPFTNMLRGVVSSTPGILTSATEAALPSKYTNKNQNNIGNNDDEEEECTAITFAKSAPHSGYLKKLGRNIHSFKRRFFVLKPSTHLYYFMSPNDVEPRGCIDLDNFVEGSGGGCQVNEIGVLPDGTFRFELLFDEEEQDLNDAILNDGDDNQNALETKNGTNHQSIVLEARTEEIGREWIAKIKSERLSVAKGQVDQLQTSLTKSEAACALWEESASDAKRRANEAEASRNVAIAEAKSWEGRFKDLNEAIQLLVQDTSISKDEDGGGETSSSAFLRESLPGLELNGTNFEDVSEAFQRIRNDCNAATKKNEYANESIMKLQQRLDEAEGRINKAEAELAQVKEDAQTVQNDLKRVKREKKILVKEVKTLHENRRLQEIENNTLKQLQSDQHSNNPPSIRSNEDQRRLILELEEHVMSGLRLSEQFLHLNGIDPSEVGDDLGSSIQTSSKASDVSPLRRRRIPAVIRAKPEIPGDDIDSTHASSKVSDMSPLRQMQSASNASPLTRLSQSNPSLQRNREMNNLLDDDDDDDDEEEVEEGEVKLTESEVTSRAEQGEASKPEFQSPVEKPVKQNLNEIFAEEPRQDAFEQAAMQSQKLNDTTNDASHPITKVASFQSSESAPSKVTDNGHATNQLVKAPQDARSESSSSAPADSRDGGVYHITFYRTRLGLQFQKVPNEMGATTSLLTNVMMTADGLDAPETTATELQRIASLSQHSQNRGGKPELDSIVPVSPVDAVIVCGFIGFDDSSGSIRPKLGARLVAFDGIPVEVGRWTFESIRKGIQARSRPLTLSFRNDPLSPKQQDILQKAVADIAAAAPPPQSIPVKSQYNFPRMGSRGESHHQYLDEQSLAAASTESSTTTSSQRFRKHYSFSETGSSISSAVAPLVSNLMKKSAKQQQRQQQSEPEYMRRQLSSHDQKRLDEFRSSMLEDDGASRLPMKSSHFIMAKNTKEIVVLDSDESGSSDVEEEVLSSKQPHRAEDDVVDLTRVSTTTITANHHNSRRRRCNTDGEVEFVGSTSARRSSAAASAASASPDIEFVGTKRPRSTNQNSHRSSIPNRMNNFNNNNYSTMNNPMSNNGAFMDRISSMLGFGGGAGLDVLNRGNFGGMTGMGSNQSASRSRFGSIHGINDHPMPTNVTSKKRKKTKTSSKPVEEKPTAMMKGKAMQQPQGFDAIDMYYPRLKANDRTSILHNLLSKCTNSRKTRKFVHDFRVKFEKVNPKSTLWRLAKELSEEITRLEGESKMSSVKKLKSEEDGNDHKENKHNVGCIDDSGSDKKPTASIGSLSGDVLDTLAIYFRAYQVGQKDHKAMLDAIEPTESPGSLTCCICSDDFDAGDTVACSGDVIHFFCKPCLSSYCTLTLESGPIQSITCAMPDCKALYATNDIKSILSEYDILKIEHREDSRDRRVAMSAKAMLHCECGVVAIVTEEDMGDGRIACPGSGCKRRFCAKCGNEDHGKESCPPPAETVQWLDKHSKQCPNCSNRIEKNGGCDHMTCCPPGGCGYEFWWTCGCPFKGQHKCGR